MRAAIIVFYSLAVIPLSGFQMEGPLWQKAALARAGPHHASIRGRFVAPDGHPVSGVHAQLRAGNFRDLPFASSLSDVDGRFSFADVNSSTTPDISWYPPSEWLEGAMAVAGEGGEDIDVGEIRLESDTVIRLAIEIIGGTPLDEKSREPTMVVLAGANNGRRIVAEKVNGLWVLRQIPFVHGDWDISLYVNDRSESFAGPFHVERGRRDQLLLLRLRRDTLKSVDKDFYEGKIDVSEVLIPEQPLEHEFHAKGAVVDPDGSPIVGAVIGVSDFILNRPVPTWTFSDAQGRFELRYSASECLPPEISFAGGQGQTWEPQLYDWQDPKSCAKVRSVERELTLARATRLVLKPTGITDHGGVHAYWWHRSLGWRSFTTLRPWISLAGWDNQIVVKLEAAGYLPVIKQLDLPKVNTEKNEKPPEHIEASFAFESATTRELRVVTDGKPVAGATVDLEWLQDLKSDKRIPLATYQTDSDGRLRLTGAAGQIVEAFVYVRGCEPQRAIWDSGEPLIFDLIPRKAKFVFSGLRPGYMVRVHRADQPESARTLRCDYDEPAQLPISAGTYDISIYGWGGQVSGYQRATIAAGDTQTIDATIDQRPKLVVRYPEEGWSASISDSTPSGFAFGWAIYSTLGGQFSISDVAAVLESESPKETVFRLSRAGRIHVELNHSGQEHTLWRELDANPGQTITIDTPRQDSTLKGSMRTYDGGIGFSHHGWAGPRMELISDDPIGWSATVPMPPRDGKHTFTLRPLPAGNYHLYQHLIGKRQSYEDSGGKENTYTSPLDAWGGIPVQLSPGGTTLLNDFIDYGYHDLAVSVLDGHGQPVRNATLRIRDRMSESWRQIAEGPTTLSNAADPIPYPPAVRIEQGRATLPTVRAGWLELLVELDDGVVIPFRASVDATGRLTLRLPSGGGAR